MWFKNLQIYRLPVPWNIGLDALCSQLERSPFVKCASNQPMSRGWVSPRKDGAMIYANNRQWLIALSVENRLLPSSVINEVSQERADEIRDQQGYPPGRKQMKEIKERVTEELMPRAFTRKRSTFVWIDPYNGWFIVDAGSPTKAEEVIEHLRHCLDEFPLKPLRTQLSPTSAMANWLAGGDAPSGFTIDRDCELEEVGEERARVAYKRHPLEGDQVRQHLAAGKLPTRLALTWDDRISFVLTEKLEIKRMAFLDLLKEQAEKDAEHADEQFDADFALMTGELSRFMPHLLDALGGELIDLAEQGSGTREEEAEFSGDSDPLYEQARQIVISNGRASISLVQRHLRIGYNRAARLVEQMERFGVVSPMDSSGSRKVLMAA